MTTQQCVICGTPTDGYLCQDNAGEVIAAVLALPGLITELWNVRNRQTRVYKAAARGKREPDQDWRGAEHALRPTTLPIDLDASSLLTDTVALWQAYRWTGARNSGLRTRQDAGDVYRAVMRGHHRAERAVDRAPSAIWAGPCGADTTQVVTEDRAGTIYTEVRTVKCDRDLYAWFGLWRTSEDDEQDDDRKILCDGFGSREAGDEGCGAVYTATDRRAWLRQSIADSLVGMDELLDVLPKLFPSLPRPPKSVVQAWVRQGRLHAVGQTHVGEPSFVGREILGLIEAYRPHKFAPRRRTGAA